MSTQFEVKPSLEPPYYAVIFTSIRSEDEDGGHDYDLIGDKLDELSDKQPGILGIDSVRSGLGITISYWKTLEDVKRWKMNSLHLVAQKRGRKEWYKSFTTRICKVERQYSFEAI